MRMRTDVNIARSGGVEIQSEICEIASFDRFEKKLKVNDLFCFFLLLFHLDQITHNCYR
jgi:hypothetical protein